MKYSNLINEKTLPSPLSNIEFDYYFQQFKEGNFEARDILIYHNMRLVYWYVKCHIRCDVWEFDDVLSLGMEALIEALYTFDNNRGTEISTYIITCVRNKTLKYFRGEEKHKKVISLDTCISDTHNTDTLADMLVDYDYDLEEDVIEKDLMAFRRNIINDELESLDDIDKMIVRMYFGFDNGNIYVQREISEALGLSQSQISKRLSRTLKKIKNSIELSDMEELYTGKMLCRKVA